MSESSSTHSEPKVKNNENLSSHGHEEKSIHTEELGHGAETQEEVHHEVTIFAEPLFNIGGFTVTNSLLNSWIVVFLLIILAIAIKFTIKKIPKGIQNFFELVIEGGLTLCDSVTNSREKSLKVFPIVFILFIFILVNNYMGLLPGIGSIGMIVSEHGHQMFIPYFRGGTADLNTTIALAFMAVVLSNLFGIISIGLWNYFNKFINIKGIVHPFVDFKENLSKGSFFKALSTLAIDLLVGIIKFGVGLIEIIGEVAKVASLSFRLFGNIFAGEVLLSSIAVIFAFLTPVPFMFLELIVGLIQALVFSILTLVYFSIASMAEEH